jgi:hypothetical protein
MRSLRIIRCGCGPATVTGDVSSVVELRTTPGSAREVVIALVIESIGAPAVPRSVDPMRRVRGASSLSESADSFTPQRTQRWACSSLGLSQTGQARIARYYTRGADSSIHARGCLA